MLEDMNNDEILARFDEYFDHAQSNLDEFFENIALNKRFVKGDQWSDEDKAVLESVKGKRALVINHILPIRNWLVGMQEENRTDHKVRARKGGYDAVARVHTACLKHIYDLCDGQQIESQQFSEGLAGGSWIFIDSNEDTDNGQFILEKPDVQDVMFDPSWRTYDPNDEVHGCKFIIRRVWFDIDYLQAKYEEVTEKIGVFDNARPYEVGVSGFLYGKSRVREEEDPDTDKYRSDAYKFYWRVPKLETVVFDKRTMDEIPLDSEDKKAFYQKLVAQFPDAYTIKERWVQDIHYALIWNSTVLEHDINPFNTRRYPCAAFFPFSDGKTRFGVIDNLRSPQEQENKNMTNATHLMGQLSNSGWKVKKAINAAARSLLEMFGSRPDIVIETDNYGGLVEKIQPNSVSEGYLTLANMGGNSMKEISGVNSANQGIADDKSESGILNIQRQKQGLTLNKPIFDNFNYTKRILGESLLQSIANTKVYTDEEVKELIAEDDLIDGRILKAIRMQLRQQYPAPPEPDMSVLLQVAPEMREMAQMQLGQAYETAQAIYEKQLDATAKPLAIQQTMELFRKSKVWQYGCITAESPESVTLKLANSQIIERIAERFPGAISPMAYIESSDLSDITKEELVNDLKKQQATVKPA